MLRHSSGGNKLHDGDLIIQKQACSSPSSPTSALKKQSLKRKVLVTKRKGSITPVHLWRTHSRSPLSMAGFSESPQNTRSKDVDKEMQIPVSARKLGNALWVLNNSPAPKIAKKLQGLQSKMPELAKEGTPGYVGGVSLPQHMYNRTNNTPLSDSNRSRSRRHRKMVLAVHECLGRKEQDSVASDLMSKACLTRIEASSKDLVSESSLVGSSKRFRDLRNGLMTSKELIKILINFRGLLKHQTSAISLARVLYFQVDQTLMLVDQLVQEKKYDQSEINRIIRKFMEEKEIWKSKKKEGIRIAVQPMIEELETERKLRRRAESSCENLRMELAQMKTSLVNANKELESERKTREKIEQVCGQMIRGIGDEKAEVEELKRESVKEREELEQERQMLQLADEWREERVQMKLSEAKYQFEEKNAAVDQLRYELEAFLAAKREQDTVNGPWGAADNLKDCLRQIVQPSSSSSSEANLIMHTRNTDGGKDQEENDGTDSEDSDLHSIELNMDSNNNGYSWNHVSAVIEDDGLILTREKNEKSTKFKRTLGNDLPSDISNISTEHLKKQSQDFDDDNLEEGRKVENRDRLGPSAERYIPLEVKRDQKLAGSSIVLPLILSSSTGQWSGQQALENKVDQVTLVSRVSELVKAIRESESKASLEKMNKVHSHLQTAPID